MKSPLSQPGLSIIKVSVYSKQSSCPMVKPFPPTIPMSVWLGGCISHFQEPAMQQSRPLYAAIGQVCGGEKVGRILSSLSSSLSLFFAQLLVLLFIHNAFEDRPLSPSHPTPPLSMMAGFSPCLFEFGCLRQV